MEARSTLRPGQKGTKKLVARFGDRLICVRYRYDAQRRKRYKTVELIVDEAHWSPPEPALAARSDIEHAPVRVRLELWESGLQRKVKAAGGNWDREQRAWLLPLDQVQALGLEARILPPQ